jgi:hypothetical protein
MLTGIPIYTAPEVALTPLRLLILDFPVSAKLVWETCNQDQVSGIALQIGFDGILSFESFS